MKIEKKKKNVNFVNVVVESVAFKKSSLSRRIIRIIILIT